MLSLQDSNKENKEAEEKASAAENRKHLSSTNHAKNSISVLTDSDGVSKSTQPSTPKRKFIYCKRKSLETNSLVPGAPDQETPQKSRDTNGFNCSFRSDFSFKDPESPGFMITAVEENKLGPDFLNSHKKFIYSLPDLDSERMCNSNNTSQVPTLNNLSGTDDSEYSFLEERKPTKLRTYEFGPLREVTNDDDDLQENNKVRKKPKIF
jgi:hypothetical protein